MGIQIRLRYGWRIPNLSHGTDDIARNFGITSLILSMQHFKIATKQGAILELNPLCCDAISKFAVLQVETDDLLIEDATPLESARPQHRRNYFDPDI